MKVKSESKVTQSCPTLSNPMDCSQSGSSIHGIFQAKVLEWGVIAFLNGQYRYVIRNMSFVLEVVEQYSMEGLMIKMKLQHLGQ